MALGLVLCSSCFGVLYGIKRDAMYMRLAFGVCVVSACLTLASSAADFQGNDEKAASDSDRLAEIKEMKRPLKDMLAECRADNYYGPCRAENAQGRLSALDAEERRLRANHTVSSKAAIDEKTFLPGWLIQGLIIAGKAFLIPLAYSFLTGAIVWILFGDSLTKPIQKNEKKKDKRESNESDTTRTKPVRESVQPTSGAAQTEIAKSGTGRKNPSEEQAKRKIDAWKQTEKGQKWIKEKGEISDTKLRAVCGIGQKKIDEWKLNDYANKKQGIFKMIKGGRK